MPNPLLIHVGFHKTGTTWLQRQLFRCERAGYTAPWGPQAGLAVDTFVTGSPFRFDPAAAREVFQPGRDEAERQGLVPVLSNEALCGSEAPRQQYERSVADRLRETFPEGRILITIRKQKSAILSHYRQHLMRGSSDRIREYLPEPPFKPGFAPHCQLAHFEYDLFVGYYQSLFGADRVLVATLEQLQADRAGYVRRLGAFLGLDGGHVPDAPADRVGWKGASLSFKRWCNRFGLGIPDWSGPRASLESRVISRLGRWVGRCSPRALDARLEDDLRAYVDRRVGTYFAGSNERLAALADLDLRAWGYDLP